VWLPVTLALVLFGIGWNLIGDGLNTVLDPRIAR
jgi:ABC-type dipeptide/oligopeptide/nickel transport system permease subunit